MSKKIIFDVTLPARWEESWWTTADEEFHHILTFYGSDGEEKYEIHEKNGPIEIDDEAYFIERDGEEVSLAEAKELEGEDVVLPDPAIDKLDEAFGEKFDGFQDAWKYFPDDEDWEEIEEGGAYGTKWVRCYPHTFFAIEVEEGKENEVERQVEKLLEKYVVRVQARAELSPEGEIEYL